ncbi:hypothetical protein HDU98_004974 [Podochytrium sp. JEL0797]|nr:hypothetical protein HDU98_004974 [Podochytrium sp. JEL0797]
MAMLSGADNAPGIPGIGMSTAAPLCRCGLADQIIPAAIENNLPTLTTHLHTLLDQFRSNSFGLLSQKKPSAVKDMDALIRRCVLEWPPLIRVYAIPMTRVDSAAGVEVVERVEGYTRGWWRREFNPDVPPLVEWYSRNCEVTIEYAFKRVCSYVVPSIRVRALRIVAYKNTLVESEFDEREGEEEGHPERVATPVRLAHKLIARILNEGDNKFGVRQVQIEWTDFGMSLGVPDLDTIPWTPSRKRGKVLTEEEVEWMQTDLEAAMSKSRKVWLDMELVRASAPKVWEEWRRTGSGVGRRGVMPSSAEAVKAVITNREVRFSATPTRKRAPEETRVQNSPTPMRRVAALGLPRTDYAGIPLSPGDLGLPIARRDGMSTPSRKTGNDGSSSSSHVISLISDDEDEEEYQLTPKAARFM